VGVVIGTAAVVVLVSLGIGLQRNATEQLGGIGDLTRIEVMPTYGQEQFVGGGGGGGGGMVAAVAGGGGPGFPSGSHLITEQALVDMAALPGVSGVYPRDYLQGPATVSFGRLESYPQFIGVQPDYLTDFEFEMRSSGRWLARTSTIPTPAPVRNPLPHLSSSTRRSG
jgi:putative ABC transport system permease protein